MEPTDWSEEGVTIVKKISSFHLPGLTRTIYQDMKFALNHLFTSFNTWTPSIWLLSVLLLCGHGLIDQ